MRHYTIPVFVPELACPNRCIFCNQRNISGALHQPDAKEVVDTIERRLATIPAGSSVEIGFFGGNFTGIDQDMQEFYLDLAKPYLQKGLVSGIRLSTRPDYIHRDNLRFLKAAGVKTIELGAQSLDDEVLQLSGRGHTAEDVRIASGLILEYGFSLGLQMMIGLPGDTIEKSLETASRIVAMGAGSTRIYPTLVIRDTELETMYRKGLYVPLTLAEAVFQTKEVVKVFEEADVKILRVGLHPSEGLLSGESLVAGPFHAAFGEMVESALWKDILQDKLAGFLPDTLSGNPKLLLEVAVGQLNAAVGHRSSNKIFLKSVFREVVFRENQTLHGRACKLFLDGNEYR